MYNDWMIAGGSGGGWPSGHEIGLSTLVSVTLQFLLSLVAGGGGGGFSFENNALSSRKPSAVRARAR